ncbi:MAG: hypothetical protein IE925_01460 [Rhodobacterales bacterium]|nr:hypothetical protein [Rhodobacterales bacterium]
MRLACLSRLPLAALPLLACPAFAETPLEKALAAPTDGPAYRFDMKIDDDVLKGEAQVDPSRPEGERLTLITPDAGTLEGEAAAKYEKLKQTTSGDKIWCSSFSGNIPADAKMISESGEAAVYSFTPLPGDDKETAKVYKHLTGRVTVSKEAPAILSFEMFSDKPFKPAMVARVDSFRMKVDCAPAPDGRTYVRDFTLDLSGNAMMQPFTQSERREITNLVALPESAPESVMGQR